MISICLLGASGSIGSQTLEVMESYPHDFALTAFSVGHQTRKISPIIKRFPSVSMICVQEKSAMNKYAKKYPNLRFFYGNEGLVSLVECSHAEMIVNALVGFVGLVPSLTALENNRLLALANKESLVVGGELIKDLLSRGKGKLFPIDSEHVALAKCLAVDSKNVKNLILTASGGSFRHLAREDLKNVTPEQALHHPTWKMGSKITIDSATMMNKTFEIIEAHYLFDYPFSKIKVIIHDESMIHSMIEYKGGTYRLDIGKADMRVPITYALSQGLCLYQTYLCSDYRQFAEYHFSPLSAKRFPVIKWAKKVIAKKGTFGAVLNAANEAAVSAFIKGKISFLDIERIVSILMKKHANIEHPTLKDILEVDAVTRQMAAKLINK
ncbi:MAG TPA: 1-deoxy-D-xylulose-5-phosphate reductoisomerase [Bacilli bacterium]|nr:1-deoxy-D-xylulose-5-phosphate reductoisomerase [Bacilli bacterium]